MIAAGLILIVTVVCFIGANVIKYGLNELHEN